MKKMNTFRACETVPKYIYVTGVPEAEEKEWSAINILKT